MTRLSGRVPETGTAISGATVAIIDTQGTDDTTQWSIVASDTTDANGEWSVSGLEPSAVERYHAVAQFDSGVEFVNFESLPYLSTPADAFAPTTPVNVGTPTAEVGFPAFFDVTITNTNTPVTEGDILTVDFSANNTGTFQDTQDIRLEIDNVEEDRDNNVTLDGGVSTTGTLQWDTTNETPAQYTATVLSNDDADSVTVQVESAIPDSVVSLYDPRKKSSTGNITTLEDQQGVADVSGNGEIISNGINGYQSLRTQGDEVLDHSDYSGVSTYPIAVIAVFEQQESLKSNNTILDGGYSAELGPQEDNSNNYNINYRENNLDKDLGSETQNPQIIEAHAIDSQTVELFQNGTLQGSDTGSFSGAEPLSGFTIGGRHGASSQVIYGDFGECVVMEDFTSSDIDQIRNRLSNNWDIPI